MSPGENGLRQRAAKVSSLIGLIRGESAPDWVLGPGGKCSDRDLGIIEAESSGSYSYFKFILRQRETKPLQIGISSITLSVVCSCNVQYSTVLLLMYGYSNLILSTCRISPAWQWLGQFPDWVLSRVIPDVPGRARRTLSLLASRVIITISGAAGEQWG